MFVQFRCKALAGATFPPWKQHETALLAHGIAAIVAALRARAPQRPALERYAVIARLLSGRSEASVDDRIEWICALCTELNIPALLAWSITEADLPGVVRKAAKVSSMQANPLPLMGEELMTVLAAARGR